MAQGLGLGLAGGAGWSEGADALTQILARRFAETQAKQKADLDAQRFAEEQRQFNAIMPLRERGVAVDEGNLGLRGREFDAGRGDVDFNRKAGQQRTLDINAVIESLDPSIQTGARAQTLGIDVAKLQPKEEPQYTLNPGDIRYQGTKPIARGGPQLPPSSGEPLISVIGPDGQPVLMPRSQATGMRPVTARKPVIGAERQALAYYNRAAEAAKVVEPLESEIAKMGLVSQTAMQYLPNWMQSQTGQSYRQAQRAFTEARLRKESGAAIPTAEYENDAKTYFAQPGDSAATIAQKRAARQEVLDGLGFASGQAFEEFYGEPFQRAAPSARPAPGRVGGPGGASPPPGYRKVGG